MGSSLGFGWGISNAVSGSTSGKASSVTVNGTPATLFADNSFYAIPFGLTNGPNTYTAIAEDASGDRSQFWTMKEEFKKQYSEAVKLHEAGQFESAKKLLLDLAEKDPKSTAVLAILGHVCLDMGDLDGAVSIFKRAVELSPTLEGVSLGLFHSLWKLEKHVEALEEVKRFQSISDSEDYREIVKEIKEKW
jgi:tetratricopeptide (TPR) repeat protein